MDSITIFIFGVMLICLVFAIFASVVFFRVMKREENATREEEAKRKERERSCAASDENATRAD